MSAAPVRERAPGLSRRRLWGFVPFTAMSAAPLPPLGTGFSPVVGSYAHQCTGNADLLCRTGADHRGVSRLHQGRITADRRTQRPEAGPRLGTGPVQKLPEFPGTGYV